MNVAGSVNSKHQGPQDYDCSEILKIMTVVKFCLPRSEMRLNSEFVLCYITILQISEQKRL